MHSTGDSPSAHLNTVIAPSAAWTLSVISRSLDLFKIKKGMHSTLNPRFAGRLQPPQLIRSPREQPLAPNLAGWAKHNPGLPDSQCSQS
jgi:hypothetical protein